MVKVQRWHTPAFYPRDAVLLPRGCCSLSAMEPLIFPGASLSDFIPHIPDISLFVCVSGKSKVVG